MPELLPYIFSEKHPQNGAAPSSSVSSSVSSLVSHSGTSSSSSIHAGVVPAQVIMQVVEPRYEVVMKHSSRGQLSFGVFGFANLGGHLYATCNPKYETVFTRFCD